MNLEQVQAWLGPGSVALVANSTLGLKRSHGVAIDAHDVVIRMNAGVPGPEHKAALGTRTDVLAVGTIRALEESLAVVVRPVHVWWVKGETRMGEKEYARLRDQVGRGERPKIASLWKFNGDWVREAGDLCGTPPSGGIGIVHVLTSLIRPLRSSLFNMDFFGALAGDGSSWWYESRPRAVVMRKNRHVGEAELALVRTWGFAEVAPGHMELE